jgi:hypothetical protein
MHDFAHIYTMLTLFAVCLPLTLAAILHTDLPQPTAYLSPELIRH